MPPRSGVSVAHLLEAPPGRGAIASEAPPTLPSPRLRTAHPFWPRPETELLLRAATARTAAAPRALDAFLARAGGDPDPERLASPDRRLLPLVAANLERLGAARPWLARVAPLRTRMAASSGRHIAAATRALRVLAAAGVPALALKGLVLVLRHYGGDAALRPMTDVDVLVAPADARRAVEALGRDGWIDRPAPARLRPYLFAIELAREDGAVLDLHQHLVDHGPSPAADRRLFARAAPLEELDAPALAPAATDLLLHVCLAGLKRGRFGNSRWVADALAILERDGARLDWDELAASARERRAALPLRECLAYLAERFDAPVPARVLGDLYRERVRGADRRAYRALTRWSATLGEAVDEYRARYELATRAAGVGRSPLGFAEFVGLELAYWWRLESAWGLPAKLAARALALARGRGDEAHPKV
jgi:hypothetical protein